MDEIKQLIQRAQNGDKRAFDALYKKFEGYVRAECIRLMKNEAMAEDAALEVFLSAWRGIGGLKNEAAFISWLKTIIKRTCFGLLRAQRAPEDTRAVSLDDPGVLAEAEQDKPVVGPDDALLDEAAGEYILSLIHHYARTERPNWDAIDFRIFGFFYEEGIENHSEIAKKISKYRSFVGFRIKSRILPVLKKVYQQLKDEGFFDE